MPLLTLCFLVTPCAPCWTLRSSGRAAWQALAETAALVSGQTVLVHAAAGGVGSFAVQIAKALGARVIGTSSGVSLAYLRDLGVDEAVDYSSTRFEDVVSEVDIVLDTMGGDTQDRSWQVLRPCGVLVSLLGFSPASVETDTTRGVRVEMLAQHANADQLRTIAGPIDAGQIRPVLESVLPLSYSRGTGSCAGWSYQGRNCDANGLGKRLKTCPECSERIGLNDILPSA